MIVILLVNDTLLVNESPPTTENGALYQSIVGNTGLDVTFDTKWREKNSRFIGGFSLFFTSFAGKSMGAGLENEYFF